MKRFNNLKVSISCLLLWLLFLPVNQNALAQLRTHEVGVLMLIKPDRPEFQGLQDGLRDAGYIDDRNLILDMPPSRSREDQRSLAKDSVRGKVNTIVTTRNVETHIAKESTEELPIVFMPASDPIAAGFVKTFPRPGTNITRVALIHDLDSYGKQLEVFRDTIPFLEGLAVLYDSRVDSSPYTFSSCGRLGAGSMFTFTVPAYSEDSTTPQLYRGARI